MTSKIIQREFVIQSGYIGLSPVSLDSRWSSFMNTFAAWEGNSDSITIRRSINLQSGYYYVTGAVDNYGSVSINGQNIGLYNFAANISRTTIGNNTRIYHGGGAMSIVISATNTGGPRGVAVTISNEKVVQTTGPVGLGTGAFGTNSAGSISRTVGDLVWSTRTTSEASVGRYLITMPFKAKITAHAWGAGGGSGGLDPEGGVGAPGLYNNAEFEVQRGDIVEVFVGSGGQYGRTTVRVGGSPGGPGGPSRINISGSAAKSFNGGTGGSAGLGGWSGGGGGGGAASGVLVNNEPAIVAGGGGGGAGGGSYGFINAPRQQASINNNATGNYALGVRALNIDNAGSITRSTQTQLVEYNTLPGMTIPPSESGSTKVLGFGYGSNVPGIFTRTAQTNSRINLVGSLLVSFFVRKGGLQVPDRGEDLHLEYSTNGSTWTNITTVSVNVANNIWLLRSATVPAGAKVAGGVFLRYRQSVGGDSVASVKDLWAMTSIFNGLPSLDFRGINGENKGNPDGGGGGGGGGGYPGGQGGAVFPGDTPGYAGQGGGNFPDNTGTTAGTNTSYYKTGFSAGGASGGNGQNGRVVLLIEPLSLLSIKVVGEWEQISEAFVKVGGTWQDIDTIFIKINDTWREINGVGQGDITLAGNTQNYGTSIRSFL